MVKLLTDYTTQIYHALSTDARPAANPGAQLREIDTGKRFIFDGTSWLELPDGGGGGGALQLLASGEYTKVTGTNLNIPVSFSGTAKVLFVCNASTEFTTAQFGAAVRVFNSVIDSNNTDLTTWFPAGPGAFLYRVVKADGSKIYVANWSDPALALTSSNTTLTCYRPSGNVYPYPNTQYKWYIYGEASA